MRMPLAIPGKTKVLKIKPTRRRQLFNAAGNAGQNEVLKNKPTRRRQLLLLRFYGYFKALHVNETKSYFSLSG
jgi:hypothetical protein